RRSVSNATSCRRASRSSRESVSHARLLIVARYTQRPGSIARGRIWQEAAYANYLSAYSFVDSYNRRRCRVLFVPTGYCSVSISCPLYRCRYPYYQPRGVCADYRAPGLELETKTRGGEQQ